ncbi:maternal pumilio protein [Enterocytozoon bieneusi H348]|nr:maternal pumilio protein [Enterocytozoon bieneusi H348]|eukprot:XP_002651133.1 maternal pumilio protein [Enterocytozoon bieneusi H348]
MCTDMYANYVVQKFFDTVDDDLKMKMKAIIGKYLKDIKAIPFTKHILNKFDK